MKKLALLLVFLMLPVTAELIIINSNDWRFVLLSMEYAHYQGDDTVFLITEAQSNIIANNLIGSGIQVFEDTKNPVVKDYSYYLKTLYGQNSVEKTFNGYKDLQEFLLKVLDPEVLFIASTIEPENTLISVPLAYKKKGILLFQSSSIFSRLTEFNEIFIVGGIDRDYRREFLSVAALLNKDVNIIDQGSPYKNSLALLDEWGPTEKLYISTGGFLEPTLLDGKYPLALVGTDTYSDDFLEVLDNLGTKMVFVIGAELMDVSQRIRSGSNGEINTMIKFAETYTSAGYAGTVFALSVYKIPIPQPNVTLANVLYDSETAKLYVKYSNYGDGLAYVSAVTRIAKDGVTLTSLTDDEVFLLWPGDEIVRIFSIDLTDYGLNNLDVNIDAKYGRYKDFLVNILDVTAPIRVTRIIDKSAIDLERATYDGSWLRVYVKNTGSVDTFVSGQVTLQLDGDSESFQLTGMRLTPGKTGVLKFRINLDENDLINNQFVTVFLKYGERQDLLVNVINQRAQLEIIQIRLELLIAPALALLFLIVIVSIVTRLKRRRYYRVGRRIRKLQKNIIGMPRTPTRRRRPRPRVRRNH